MRIAIIGWGSLIEEPDGLRIVDGEWHVGGPRLPIELSRLSSKRRHLTYVIDERHRRSVPTRYAISRDAELATAIDDLARREGCAARRIGYIRAGEGTRHRSRTSQWNAIQKWVRAKRVDAVIWTDLAPRPGRFTLDAAVRFWKRLPAETQVKAREYARMAPKQTNTDLRRRLQREKLI
jgi:hypothetical protein